MDRSRSSVYFLSLLVFTSIFSASGSLFDSKISTTRVSSSSIIKVNEFTRDLDQFRRAQFVMDGLISIAEEFNYPLEFQVNIRVNKIYESESFESIYEDRKNADNNDLSPVTLEIDNQDFIPVLSGLAHYGAEKVNKNYILTGISFFLLPFDLYENSPWRSEGFADLFPDTATIVQEGRSYQIDNQITDTNNNSIRETTVFNVDNRIVTNYIIKNQTRTLMTLNSSGSFNINLPLSLGYFLISLIGFAILRKASKTKLK